MVSLDKIMNTEIKITPEWILINFARVHKFDGTELTITFEKLDKKWLILLLDNINIKYTLSKYSNYGHINEIITFNINDIKTYANYYYDYIMKNGIVKPSSSIFL